MMKGIIIVDDSEVIRSRLTEMLKGIDNLEITGWAEDVQGAVDIIKKITPMSSYWIFSLEMVQAWR